MIRRDCVLLQYADGILFLVIQHANYYGSLTQSSTTSLGIGPDGKEVYIPLKDLLPMVSPNDLEFDGWDVSSTNLAEACERAMVSIHDYLSLLPFPS